MALLCPINVPQPSQNGCVGNFVSKDQVHLVSPDGYDLVFEQVVPSTNQRVVRLPLAINGQVVGLHRVPYQPRSLSKESATDSDGLDILLIHTQTKDADSDEVQDGFMENHLYFKLYSPETQELTTISTFTSDCGRYHSLTSSWVAVAICLEPGAMLGTVAFASNDKNSTLFLDPFNTDTPTLYHPNETRGAVQSAGVPWWITGDLVAVTRRRSDQMSYAIEFLKVERRPRNAKSTFKVTTIDRVSLPPGLKVQGLGPARKVGKEPMISAVLSDDTVNTYAIINSAVELVDEKRLDLTKVNVAATRHNFDGCLYREWFVLPSKRSTESYFISDDALVLMIQGVGDFKLFPMDGLPRDALLSPLGSGMFKLKTGRSSPVRLIQIRAGENPKELSIQHEVIKTMSYEFDDAQLFRHDFNPFFGSSFWFSFKGSMGRRLCKTERSILSRVFSIQKYPFTAPVSGVWLIDNQLLVSTAAQTSTYELKGSQLARVESEFDCDAPTIAAAPGVQVTRDTVRLAGGLGISLPFSAAVSAAIDGPRVVVASSDVVLIIENGHVVDTKEFEDVIIGVGCRDSQLAVCTTSALHIRHGLSGANTVCPLRQLPTSVACGANGHVYVGDAEGYLYIWPEDEYLKVANNPVKSVRAQGADGVTVLAGRNGSVYVDVDQKVSRLEVGDASDIILRTSKASTGVALIDGVLKILDIDAEPSMVPRLIDASELIHTRPEGVKVWGDHIYCFGLSYMQRTLQRAPLSNVELIQTYEIPPFTRANLSDFQVFMLSETLFLEFARRDPAEMPSDSEDDDEDLYDFESRIIARLYEIQPDLGKISLLDEKEFKLSGDPYEEVVVKFYSPCDFVVFIHSASALAGSGAAGVLKVGKEMDFHEYLYDDHWIPTGDGGVTIVSFSGDVMRVSPQELRETEPLPRCFENPTSLGNISETYSTDCVFNVLKTSNSTPEAMGLVISSRTKSGENVGKVTLVEVAKNQVKKVADMQVHDQSLSLSAINERMATSVRAIGNAGESKYLQALLPDAAIGTSRGGVYFCSTIKDNALAEALLKVQTVLRQSTEMLGSTVAENANSIDGALLMAGLTMPGAESLFADVGLNGGQLKKALEFLMSI